MTRKAKRFAVCLFLGMCIGLAGCIQYSSNPSYFTLPSDSALGRPGAPDTAASTDSLKQLIEQIAARFDDPEFAHAHWGVLIQSMDTGRVWYERNANRLFIPASNQKIPTTAAALMELGPDFTFETLLCHTGEIKGDTLEGDLVVFGDGDPTLYEKFFKDSREVFRGWAGQLKQQGIKRIVGDIVGNDDAFDDEHIGYGWSYDGLPDWPFAEVGALQLNENYIDFTITPPADAGGEVQIKGNLPSAYYTVDNRIEVTPRGRNRVSNWRDPFSNTIIFRGSVVAGSRPFELSPTITNPTLFYVTVLKEVLEEEGIAVEGMPRDCDDIPDYSYKPADLACLITHHSPPAKDILTMLMKRSQNLFAETMVKTLGRKRTGLGTFAAGREVVEEKLAAFGIEPGSYAFQDGSGLSRYNFISPRQLVTILREMRNSPHWDIWYGTFPIAGVDGTLRNRMKNTAAEGKVRGKTGTVSNVRSLSGYVTTADGENLAYSMIVNAHVRGSRATEEITDDVCAMLAAFDRKAGCPEPPLAASEIAR